MHIKLFSFSNLDLSFDFFSRIFVFNTIVVSLMFLFCKISTNLIILSVTLDIRINFDSSKKDLFSILAMKLSKLFNISFSS